jgi:8-oxo-dGTP pyrophosphatase MutT (NUDIX family)
MSPHVRRIGKINIKKLGKPKPSGVLILLYEVNGIIKFPLIQRPKYKGAHSGQVSFPGGKKEETDRDYMETALREAEEEIGVDPANVDIIGYLSELYIWASNFTVQPVLGFASGKPEFEADVSEVDEIIEAELNDILDKGKIKKREIKTSLGLKIDAPYFDIQGKVVWGATAMMLSELADLIRRSEHFN